MSGSSSDVAASTHPERSFSQSLAVASHRAGHFLLAERSRNPSGAVGWVKMSPRDPTMHPGRLRNLPFYPFPRASPHHLASRGHESKPRHRGGGLLAAQLLQRDQGRIRTPSSDVLDPICHCDPGVPLRQKGAAKQEFFERCENAMNAKIEMRISSPHTTSSNDQPTFTRRLGKGR